MHTPSDEHEGRLSSPRMNPGASRRQDLVENTELTIVARRWCLVQTKAK